MANNILRSVHQGKGFHVLGLFSLMLMVQQISATQFTIGGAKGWTVPDNTSATNYNQWAEHNRFQIGDSLLFVYKSDQDSVLEVNKENYGNCVTSDWINKYSDGHTVFTFDHSGPHYFISGNKDNCLKGEKLLIIVLADRTKQNAASPPSPSPSPTTTETAPPSPSPSPTTTETTPPSPTTTETSPSPAPTGTVELPPTPPPAADHKNAASSLLASFIGSVGAFFASSLILVF